MNEFIRSQLAKAVLDPDSGIDVIPMTTLLLEEPVWGNEKRPPTAKVWLPQDWVRNMKGYAELRDAYFVVRLPVKSKSRNRVQSAPDESASATGAEAPSDDAEKGD